MSTIKLTIKGNFFHMILAQVKKEEYREIKEYYFSRLCTPSRTGTIIHELSQSHYEFKKFTAVEFINGYNSKSPRATFELLELKIGTGKTEWGAIKDKEYFVLSIGKQIK